jgi:hypothetical protein
VISIRLAEARDSKELAALCTLLWPESPYEEHLAEMEAGPCALGQPFTTNLGGALMGIRGVSAPQ